MRRGAGLPAAASASGPARAQARRWQVLIIPPAPGLPTRSFQLSRWQIGLSKLALATGAVLSLSAVAAAWLFMMSPELLEGDIERAALRSRLLATSDSLALTRMALLDAHSAVVVAPWHPVLPVAGAVTSGFSLARRHPLLHIIRPHLGIDLPAPAGTLIHATAPGRVRFVGWRMAFGRVVEVEHANGVVTRFAHCSRTLVEEGEIVRAGTTLAAVGSSGLTTGPHLHYEVLVNGVAVDPMRYRFP